MNFGGYQLKRCKYGWMLFSGPFIGKCLELYGQYSEAEVRVIKSFVKPGDTVIDVGANIGDLTLPMSVCAGDEGRVYAIESHAATFNVLCSNLALNGIRNTKPINAFIADSTDVDTSGPWGKYGYVDEKWGPPFLSIDSLGLERCSFIKVDVDGKELEVLRSANATIARTRPAIYFENDDRSKSADLLEHVLALGYDLYWHLAPIFEESNFFGNPVNHWTPRSITSLMVIGMASERCKDVSLPLKRVTSKNDWPLADGSAW